MPGGRVSDEMAWDAMTALAGHFDHYVTANDDAAKHRREGFPGVLQKGLVAAGVRDDMITVRDNLDDALDEALALARPDNLVMMLGGQEPEMLQRRLQALAARAKVQASP
jgi:hypothetical protein